MNIADEPPVRMTTLTQKAMWRTLTPKYYIQKLTVSYIIIIVSKVLTYTQVFFLPTAKNWI